MKLPITPSSCKKVATDIPVLFVRFADCGSDITFGSEPENLPLFAKRLSNATYSLQRLLGRLHLELDKQGLHPDFEVDFAAAAAGTDLVAGLAAELVGIVADRKHVEAEK